jgi:hypothetical protein
MMTADTSPVREADSCGRLAEHPTTIVLYSSRACGVQSMVLRAYVAVGAKWRPAAPWRDG